MLAAWASATQKPALPAWLLRCWDRAAHGGFGQHDENLDVSRRAETVRYHLGRGRRAREAGRFEDGASEARRAINANAGNPWAYSLLGQCLARQRRPDLVGARRALEWACALDPTNGYFVGLLLDVLDAQGDRASREDALAWAWWSGAPVERWLPNGPNARRRTQAAPDRTPAASRSPRIPQQALA
jgi:hypothetical protein